MQRKNYLSGKQLLTILILCIASLSIISTAYIDHVKGLMHEETQTMVEEITLQGAIGIEDKLQEEFLVLESLIETIIKDKQIAFEEKLSKLAQVKEVKGIKSIGIASPEGILTTALRKQYDISDEAYFQMAKQGTACISDVLVSKVDGEPTIIYAMPIYHQEEIKGILVTTYWAEELFEKIVLGFFEGKGSIYILDEEGHIQYCSKSINPQFISGHQKWHTLQGHDLEKDYENNLCEGYLRNLGGTYYALSHIPSKSNWHLLYTISDEVVAGNSIFIIKNMRKTALWMIFVFTIILTYTLIAGEISKRKIYRLAYLNSETGLYNHNKFIEEANKRLIKKSEQYSVVYFDVDNFRVYNEIFSETFGRAVIQKISEKLKQLFIEHDILFAHLGGDHFAILLPYVDEHKICGIVQILEQKLEKIQIEGYPHVHIILSVGIYLIPLGSQDIKGAINKASLARQRIKGYHDIRHNFFDEKESNLIKANRKLESDILKAIETKQFSVYYQPKFGAFTNRLAGAEALIRWDHPNEGMISPGRFIPIAEANGSILEITRYVIMQVCKDIRVWQRQQVPLVPISINFSQIEMYNPGILEYIKNCLIDYEIEAKWIEIEITERVALEDLQRAKKMILAFKELGLKVSMDDFGSGYSGANYMKYLPFDTIKIDKTLIDDIDTDIKSKQLLLGLVNVIKSLDLDIVAEGVENADQVQCIQNMGIDYIQGFVFSRPMTREEFEWKLRGNQDS